MAIPNIDQIRRPALKLLAERGTLTKIGEIFDLLAPEFNLTEEDRHEMLPSGTQRKWNNRVNWSCFDLYKAKLLDRPKKGFYQINDAGHKALPQLPHEITRKDLSELSEAFKDFVTPKHPGSVDLPGLAFPPDLDEGTPEEKIDMAMQSIDSSLRSELLDHLTKVDPYRFEQVVVDLLFAMGYGGSREEAARVTKKSGDEGIDGVINEDRLGLDVIYVQAKRWQNVVGRKEIQSFVGALAGQQANTRYAAAVAGPPPLPRVPSGRTRAKVADPQPPDPRNLPPNPPLPATVPSSRAAAARAKTCAR
jgi:restriction system protein